MLTSSADVFRTRQAIGDLRSYIRSASDTTIERLAAGIPAAGKGANARAQMLRASLQSDAPRFKLPHDEQVYTAVLLAAAMPDDDYPSFALATALLLADLLNGGGMLDDLYWNWETFQAQYRLADPPVRAAVMNGFRTASRIGLVSLGAGPTDDECLTRSSDAVLHSLQGSGRQDLVAMIEVGVSASDAGRAWVQTCAQTQYAVNAFRYLYERADSIAPTNPLHSPLIPWRH